MADLELNQTTLRQGAAAAACVAAVAAALPALSHRGAEQRTDAIWAARAAAFQTALANDLKAQGPAARVELASFGAADLGYRLAGRADVTGQAGDRQAMIVQAAIRDQASLNGLGALEPARLSNASRQAREQHCLAQAIYFEARGESHVGQLAVAEVVVNRVKSKHYPDTFCDVVYEGSWRSTGCQFTFTCDGSLKRKPRGEAWRQANTIAAQVVAGLVQPKTHGATHYHTTEVAPVWSASLVETTRIGAHIFYRFPNRSERAALRARAEAEALAAAGFEDGPIGEGEEAMGGPEAEMVVEPEAAPLPPVDAPVTAAAETAPVAVL